MNLSGKTYPELLKLLEEKMRYGDLWKEFQIEDLYEYARIKALRGSILLKRGQVENAEDDFLDAANILLTAVLRIYHDTE